MKTELSRFLSEEILAGTHRSTVGPDEDLLGSGLLDSLGVMQLVWFIEREFGVEVPPEDVTIEHFQSISHIVAYLTGRRAA